MGLYEVSNLSGMVEDLINLNMVSARIVESLMKFHHWLAVTLCMIVINWLFKIRVSCSVNVANHIVIEMHSSNLGICRVLYGDLP